MRRARGEAREVSERLQRTVAALSEKEEAWSRTVQGMRREMEEAVHASREA